MKKHILCSMLAASVLASCTQDDLVEQGTPLPAPVPLVLNATGLDVVATPVTRGEVTDLTTLQTIAVAEGTDGEKKLYTYDTDGNKWSPQDEANTIWWNYNDEKKTLTAWHPHTADKPAAGVTWTASDNQTDGIKTEDDLLYANSTVSFTDRENASLTFRHMLAKVVININSSAYLNAYSPNDVTVTLDNMLVDGTFNQNGSKLELEGNENESSTTIQPHKLSETHGYFAAYEALVMPQYVQGEKRRIIVQVGETTKYAYTIVMDKAFMENNSFDGGYKYIFNITVDDKKLNVSTDSSIAWTTEDSATGSGSVTLP